MAPAARGLATGGDLEFADQATFVGKRYSSSKWVAAESSGQESDDSVWYSRQGAMSPSQQLDKRHSVALTVEPEGVLTRAGLRRFVEELVSPHHLPRVSPRLPGSISEPNPGVFQAIPPAPGGR